MLDYGYVFVTPEYIEGKGKSVHIFEVESMNVKNGKTNYNYKRNAVCNKVKSKKDKFKHRKTKKDVRKYALKLQDKGDQVCSVCIGKFHGDVK